MLDVKHEILKDRKICNVIKLTSTTSYSLDAIARILQNGANFLQIGQSNLKIKEYFEILLKIRQLCSMYDSILIVEDRIDIVKLVHADGIFISEDSIDYKFLSKLIDKDMIIGTNIPNSNFANYLISDTDNNKTITYINSDNALYIAKYEVL